MPPWSLAIDRLPHRSRKGILSVIDWMIREWFEFVTPEEVKRGEYEDGTVRFVV